MFHRVFIQPEDRSSQLFLWRGMARDIDPEVYQMEVMVFGAASSPTSAQYVKNKHADLYIKEYPEEVDAIKRSFYVDDCLHSSVDSAHAIKMITNIIKIQTEGGFDICNWISSSQEVIQSLSLIHISE